MLPCWSLFNPEDALRGAIGCCKNSSKLVWRCHQLLSWFLTKCQFPWVSRLSAERVIIMIPGAVHSSSGTLHLRNTSSRRPSIKSVLGGITSNGARYFQMALVGSDRTSDKEKEVKKEWIRVGSLKGKRKERRKGFYPIVWPVIHGAVSCSQKKLPSTPVQVPSQIHLALNATSVS